MNPSSRARVVSLLSQAGVRVNGEGPADLRVNDPRFFDRVLSRGSLGLGESYMDGWWETEDLVGLLRRLLEARLGQQVHTLRDGWLELLARLSNRQRGRRAYDPWIEKYIFPNSVIPSAAQISRAVEGLFVIEDWHNFDERFRRMWRFYLDGARANFECRRLQLWQLVLSPRGVPGGYQAPR